MADFVIRSDDPKGKQILYDYLRSLKGEYVIKVKKRSKVRSAKENSYYWAVCLSYISEITGHSPIYLHEYYKYKFIPAVRFTDDSRLTTADMTHQELWDYINMIREDAKKVLKIDIPDPDGVIL